MPQRQFTKLWGLKKLKKIAQGLPSNVAGVAPYLVRPKDPHLREADLRRSKRLLVRTDERGKAYRRLQWAYVPRYSVDIPVAESKKQALSRYIRMRTRVAYDNEKNFFDGNAHINPLGRFKHLRHILHPTRAYSERNAESMIEIFSDGIHVNLPTREEAIILVMRGKRFFRTKKDNFTPGERMLLGNIMRFLKQAIRSRQINPLKSRRFVLRYSLWNDSPHTPEFYDLQEYREMQSQNKNKKEGKRPPSK